MGKTREWYKSRFRVTDENKKKKLMKHLKKQPNDKQAEEAL